ncbi:uncharacterized protein PV09_03602 [Verruconis gallopava]|uniref:DUF7371 domain-containing protein n=1 Tax=Verruconis gallopava TaxID=253628 RepID=A0A0D1XSM1_9PEZI|nr:uncharacterized protein PV09_03602 [Verruconis gallopava]KIW05746.1 hypothetical protein PV09_03602 [Verruconis gallopava]
MKWFLAIAALACRLAMAHPTFAFPFYSAGNSSHSSVTLPGTRPANYSHAIISAASILDSSASKTSGRAPCGCSTSVTTTTLFVPATAMSSAVLGLANAADTSQMIVTKSDQTVVDSSAYWSSGVASRSDPTHTILTTLTAYVVPFPPDVYSKEVTFTVTSQRTLTSTTNLGSTSLTTTVIVTETFLTTIHVSRPSSSATSMSAFPIAGETTAPTSIISIGAPSPSPILDETSTEILSSHPDSTLLRTSSSSSSLSSSASNGLIAALTSSQSEVTLITTSLHVVSLSNSTFNGPTSSNKETTSAFPMFPPLGTDSITFFGPGTGSNSVNFSQNGRTAGALGVSAIVTSLVSAAAATNNYTTYTNGVSIQVPVNTASTPLSLKTSFGHPFFSNSSRKSSVTTTSSAPWSSSASPEILTSQSATSSLGASNVSYLSSTLSFATTQTPTRTVSVLATNIITTSSRLKPSVSLSDSGFSITNSSEIGSIGSHSTSTKFLPITFSNSTTFSSSTIQSNETSDIPIPISSLKGSVTNPVGYGQIKPYPTVLANASSSCGETGDFIMNWDDEPIYEQTHADDPPYAPVFNPYHHLFFAAAFSYYNPAHSISKTEPYDPISGPNVAIFHVKDNTTIANADQLDSFGMLPGTIGAGPRANNEYYWFNVYGVELGCDNSGPKACNMSISGYVWSNSTNNEEKSVTQTTLVQPCSQLVDCKLQHVSLEGFRGLSSIRIEAIVDGNALKSWVIDNLNMGWFDNSCKAGLTRSSQKK